MEDFIEYILFLLLIFLVAFTGLIVFLLEKNPVAGYLLIVSFFGSLAGGIGALGWRFYRKKRLEPYYELLREILQLKKGIVRSTRRLDRHVQKLIREQFPKIHQLCKESQKRLYKVTEIDKVIASLEQKYINETGQSKRSLSGNRKIEEKIQESHKRYSANLLKIKETKNQYMQEVEQVLRFLQELNSQILALTYSKGNVTIQQEIADTIDELLIDMHTLEEIT